jgi:hypothetical protein
MKNSKKSSKGKKESIKKKSEDELRKPSKLAPTAKDKVKDAKNWKGEDDEDDYNLPLDDDFKGFNDFYEADDDDDEF